MHGIREQLSHRARLRAGACVLLAMFAPGCSRAQAAPNQLTVEQIAQRLQERNDTRRAALRSYESRRVMQVAYKGSLANTGASETVLMRFFAPASKQFSILAATGPQVLRDGVFQKEINSEAAATKEDAQRASAMTLENYTMQMQGQEVLPQGRCYVLAVLPRRPSQFAYVGTIWVQATDFAVVRIKGRPAQNPSPFVSAGEFTTDFTKVGDFYFPLKTVSSSQVLFGGDANFTIDYDSYRILDASPVPPGR